MSVHKTVWPSGLRRWLQAPFRKGVGSNPTAVILDFKLYHAHGHRRVSNLRNRCSVTVSNQMTAVGFEPTPLRTGALSQRLRQLGQTVLTVCGVSTDAKQTVLDDLTP